MTDHAGPLLSPPPRCAASCQPAVPAPAHLGVQHRASLLCLLEAARARLAEQQQQLDFQEQDLTRLEGQRQAEQAAYERQGLGWGWGGADFWQGSCLHVCVHCVCVCACMCVCVCVYACVFGGRGHACMCM